VKWFAFLLLTALPLSAQTPAVPTFAHDIAPIVYKNCAPCHRRGEPGPFSLLTYEDVKKHARQMVAVTRSRYMPPWPPEQGYGKFLDERRLTDAQLRTISDWVKAGTPEGPAAEVPPPPHFSTGWQLGTPDLILTAPRPFTVPAGGPDVFWNFIFQPNLKRSRYVRAIEIRPGLTKSIHHANLLLDRSGDSRRLEATPGAGFGGMDLTIDRSPFDPDSHFLFWKPGSTPYSETPGFSWRLDPGNLLVLNTHLQPTGRPEQEQPTIGLYFTDQPPTHFPILIQLEHDGALNIPAGDPDFEVSDDFTLPEDVDVLAVYPHAHYLGKLLEGYATLPDGTRRWLIRIPHWDLNWQAVYRYCTPVFLPKGSVIHMRYHYDNSAANPRNPNSPPKRVMAGNQATDEMGHLWLQVLPRGAGDHRRPIQEALMRHRLQKYPDDFAAHMNLGALMLSRLDAQDAIPMLRAAVRIDPTRADAQNMLGTALQSVGRLQEAIAQFRLALQLQPGYLNAHYNLAGALVKSGDLPEAVEQFRPVIAAYPEDPHLQNQFGELLAEEGKTAEALVHFDKAIALNPAYTAARQNRELVERREAVPQ